VYPSSRSRAPHTPVGVSCGGGYGRVVKGCRGWRAHGGLQGFRVAIGGVEDTEAMLLVAKPRSPLSLRPAPAISGAHAPNCKT